MGSTSSTSTVVSTDTGQFAIVSHGGTAHGTISGVTFSSAPGTGSTVANATAKMLRIFYHREEIKLEDLLAKADSQSTKRVFKPKTEISFIELQTKQQLVAPSVEEGFASVLVPDPENTEVYAETISLNFPVPYGACCIVTAKNKIKFRKSDGGVWIDEDGCDHCPK